MLCDARGVPADPSEERLFPRQVDAGRLGEGQCSSSTQRLLRADRRVAHHLRRLRPGSLMTLLEQVNRDITAAMKAQQPARLSALRMLKTAITNKGIEKGHD